MKYPFNVRSFFTDRETKDIGGGLILWRGYFQSVRPAIGQLLVNVDISTGTMYKPGPLLDLCLDFLGRPGQYNILSPRRGMPDRERIRLQRFITGIRIMTTYTGERVRKTPRVVKKLSSAGASDLSFSMRDGTTMTVAQYFQKLLNRPLRFPENICIEVCTFTSCFRLLKSGVGWIWRVAATRTLHRSSRPDYAQTSASRENERRAGFRHKKARRQTPKYHQRAFGTCRFPSVPLFR